MFSAYVAGTLAASCATFVSRAAMARFATTSPDRLGLQRTLLPVHGAAPGSQKDMVLNDAMPHMSSDPGPCSVVRADQDHLTCEPAVLPLAGAISFIDAMRRVVAIRKGDCGWPDLQAQPAA